MPILRQPLRVGPAGNGLVKRPTHHLTIRVDAGPELDVDRPLVEQHATAIEGPRTSLTVPAAGRNVSGGLGITSQTTRPIGITSNESGTSRSRAGPAMWRSRRRWRTPAP